MAVSTLLIVIAVVLIAHGIGHYMGVLSAFGVRLSPKSSSQSWLFTNLLGEKISRIISFIIWILALLGFIGAGLSLLGWILPQNIWEPLGIISAILFLAGLMLFWNAFAFIFNKIGALGVNIAVLVALLILHWPSDLIK